MYKADKFEEVRLDYVPPICAGENCTADAAPGNVFCWRCIRRRSRPVKDYQEKIRKSADAQAARFQARMRPRLYAVALGAAVKFGISVDARRRLHGLQTGLPDELTLIGHVGCDRRLEKDVHKLCEAHHIRGEWFRREGMALTVEHCIAENNVLEIYRLVGRMPNWAGK